MVVGSVWMQPVECRESTGPGLTEGVDRPVRSHKDEASRVTCGTRGQLSSVEARRAGRLDLSRHEWACRETGLGTIGISVS